MLAPTVARDRILVRFRSDAVAAALLMALAFGLRVASFGDPNLHVDETFYFYVAERMHQGALLYVDIWDRKPPGLFLIYYLIVGIWDNVIAYQVAATVVAGLTAWTVFLIARTFVNWQGAFFAGCVYVVMLGPLQGFGGQASVFYNLPVAAAALIVLKALPALREGETPRSLYCAFLLLGFAITIKQTTFVEGAYFGVYCTWLLWRSPAPRSRRWMQPFVWAGLGAAPFLIFCGAFALSGHWFEFWQAMVTSNFKKEKPDILSIGARSILVSTKILPLFCLMILSSLIGRRLLGTGKEYLFVGTWVAAALAGFLVIPNIYIHYAIALLPSFSAFCAPFLARGFGIAAMAGVAASTFVWHDPFAFSYSRESRMAMDRLRAAVLAHDSNGVLLIYDGPPLLYSVSGLRAPTPLAFPLHLNHEIERNVSHIDTGTEIKRILALRPGAIVMAREVRNFPVNWDTRRMVLAYVATNCRDVGLFVSPEMLRTDNLVLYGDCGVRFKPPPGSGKSR